MKVMALDFGSARTGVAVSDPTGILARPLCVVERAAGEAGLAELARLVRERGGRAGRRRAAADAARHARRAGDARRSGSSGRCAAVLDVPVVLYDERFTTDLARQTPAAAPVDALAAAHLLSDYLRWSSATPA